jgi:isocitrate dehydrogenase (NAD+)
MRVVRIDGDGIGPEIVAVAVDAVEATGVPVEWVEMPAGDVVFERSGEVVPRETLEAIREVGAALKGPFSTPSGGSRRSPNFYIRRDLDLFACVRPIVDRRRGIDILLVRENVEDLYGAIEWTAAPGVAHAVKVASEHGCRRIAEFAVALARRLGRRRLTVVHKANNLKLTEGMFLGAVREVAAVVDDLAVDDLLADTAAAEFVLCPEELDVVVTTNTFGDLLSSVGAAVVGSLGLVPSSNHGADGSIVTEPSHGSAPQLAGRGRANPVAAIGAAGMLLEGLGYADEGGAIRDAAEEIREEGIRTPDLGGVTSTSEVGQHVCGKVRQALSTELSGGIR